MTERQDVNMGRSASEVLENQAFQEAMNLLREAVVTQWKECPVRDKEGALLLLQLAKITDKFEGLLVGLVEKGKMAQHKIELDALRDESKLQKAARKFF